MTDETNDGSDAQQAPSDADTDGTTDAPPANADADDPGGDAADEGPQTLREKAGALVRRVVRLLPYFSLLSGVVSALIMDRSANAAAFVIGAALLGWFAVLGFGGLQRIDADRLEGKKALLLKVGAFSTIFIMQTLMQQCLFFALPYYALSASLVPGHILFLLVLAGCCAITLWDPLFEKIVGGAGGRFGLQFLSAFVSFNAMLPALGVTNTWSLFLSAGGAALGIPLQGWVFKESSRNELITATVVFVVGMPLMLVAGLGRSIPPAPLMLSKGEMGTRYDAAALKVADPSDEVRGRPSALVCGTDIRAPRGLREELFHVWRNPQGEVSDEIKLTIRGGRKEGFRTYTRKGRLGKKPWGTWTCSVVTQVGQLVGRRSIEVLEPAAP
jgi:hypothetical protein